MFSLFVAVVFSAETPTPGFDPTPRLVQREERSDMFIKCEPVHFKIDPIQILMAYDCVNQIVPLKRFECNNLHYRIQLYAVAPDAGTHPDHRARLQVIQEEKDHTVMKGKIVMTPRENDLDQLEWSHSTNGLSHKPIYKTNRPKEGVLQMSIYSPKEGEESLISNGKELHQKRFAETLFSEQFADFEVRNSEGVVLAKAVKFLLAAQSEVVAKHLLFNADTPTPTYITVTHPVDPEIVKAAVRFASLGPEDVEDKDLSFDAFEALEFANFWEMPAYEEFLLNKVYDDTQETAEKLLRLHESASAIQFPPNLFKKIVHKACGTSAVKEVMKYLLGEFDSRLATSYIESA